MSAPGVRLPRTGVLRHSRSDGLLVGLAILHGALLLLFPSVALVAFGLWWNANTISHNFIHLPFFRRRAWNAVFSVYLSALLGFPHALWRDRHLAHHAGVGWRFRWNARLAGESAAVIGVWGALALLQPGLLLLVYLPGWSLGLILCAVHGHYEHAKGTVSHYGALYNLPLLNDGYHAEHHAHPTRHWSRLPSERKAGGRASAFPAVLRWIEVFHLDSLEKVVLRFSRLQRFVMRCHERAFRRLLPTLPPVRRVTVVGGGLFPRSALILAKLIPEAEITILDCSSRNLEAAETFLPDSVRMECGMYRGDRPVRGTDLLVIPLAFRGERADVYRNAVAPAVLVHDWIWRRRGPGAVVSILLLKRLNLVAGPAEEE